MEKADVRTRKNILKSSATSVTTLTHIDNHPYCFYLYLCMQCYIAPEPYTPIPVIECSKPNIYFKKYCKACLQCPLKYFSFTNWNYIKWNNPLTYF